MSTTAVVTHEPKRSLIAAMAENYGMGNKEFYDTLLKTVMPSGSASNEQVAAFLMVAKRYDLNPFCREIYAFPGKAGGIQPIVSIDGWMTLANRHPQFDGITFVDHMNDSGKLASVTAQVHRKDREHPVEVTEYMSECARSTDPWKQFPARMLRHKAAIQAIRYAFGFSGIMDPDEAERMDAQPSRGAAAELNQTLKGEVHAEIEVDPVEELELTPPSGPAPEEVDNDQA